MKYDAAGRAAEVPVLDAGRRRPARGPLRGPGRRRQGRHDQAVHGAPEPAGCPCRGADEADRRPSRASGTSSATCSTFRPPDEIVLFDRSWYNRAGVERVMGFCTPEQYELFLRQAPVFEKMLIEAGTSLTKFWFSVTQRRAADAVRDPADRPGAAAGSCRPMDVESLDKWEAYTSAKEETFLATDTDEAPWITIKIQRQEAGSDQRDAAFPVPVRLRGQGPCPGWRGGSEAGGPGPRRRGRLTSLQRRVGAERSEAPTRSGRRGSRPIGRGDCPRRSRGPRACSAGWGPSVARRPPGAEGEEVAPSGAATVPGAAGGPEPAAQGGGRA